jgi:hypothetical protein
MSRSNVVNIKKPAHGICMVQLTGWAGLKPDFMGEPESALDVFDTYARATGCTLKEVMELAAQALLKDFKENAVEE